MLYFKKAETENEFNFVIIFSDKHYRNEAISALEALINGVGIKSPTSIPSLEEKFDYNDKPPYLYLHPQATETRRICFELGVTIDQDGEKWKAACLEQTSDAAKTAAEILNEHEEQPINTDSNVNVLHEYIKNACRTECEYTEELRLRAANYIDLLHGAIGLCTEVGELQDQIKRFVFYGKQLDIVNIEEELGDIAWYYAIICNALQLNWDEILKKNTEKLKARFPAKFTEEHAINRDLDKERSVLEEGNKG